jgi:hypothetical protein
MRLARICLVVIAGFLLMHGLTMSAQDARLQSAQRSVEEWLALTDATRYADSRREASAAFQAGVSEETWSHDMQTVRRWPLGYVESRKLKSVVSSKSLAGAPDGEYVVVTYDTSFEYKQAAVETVTASLEKDGVWRVGAYTIQ